MGICCAVVREGRRRSRERRGLGGVGRMVAGGGSERGLLGGFKGDECGG